MITQLKKSKKRQMCLINSKSLSNHLSFRLATLWRIRILRMKLSLDRNSVNLGTLRTTAIVAGLLEWDWLLQKVTKLQSVFPYRQRSSQVATARWLQSSQYQKMRSEISFLTCTLWLMMVNTLAQKFGATSTWEKWSNLRRIPRKSRPMRLLTNQSRILTKSIFQRLKRRKNRRLILSQFVRSRENQPTKNKPKITSITMRWWCSTSLVLPTLLSTSTYWIATETLMLLPTSWWTARLLKKKSAPSMKTPGRGNLSRSEFVSIF